MSMTAPNPSTSPNRIQRSGTSGATASPNAIDRQNQPTECGTASKPLIANSPKTFAPASRANGIPSTMSARNGYGPGRPAASQTSGMSSVVAGYNTARTPIALPAKWDESGRMIGYSEKPTTSALT